MFDSNSARLALFWARLKLEISKLSLNMIELDLTRLINTPTLCLWSAVKET